jgi:hypothetical protein
MSGLGRRLAGLAVIGLLSACGGAQARGGPASPSTSPRVEQVTPAGARAIALQAWRVSQVRAQARPSAQALRELHDGPALAAGLAAAAIRSQLGRRQQRPAPLRDLTVYVPRLAGYPLWFAAVLDSTRVDPETDVVGTEAARYLQVFVRGGPGERWKVYLDVDVTALKLPEPELDSAGYVAGDPGQLVATLEDVPQAYVDYLRSAGKVNTTLFGPGAVTSQAAWEVAHPMGGSYSFATDHYLRFQLPLRGGGALGLFSISRRFIVTPLQGACLEQDVGRSRAPIWIPPGRWQSVAVDVAAVRVAIIPLAASSTPIALSGDDLITAVTPKKC